MIALKDLQKTQATNKTMLCLGLDLDPKRIPSEYAGSLKGMFDFAHRIIDATADKVCAYKPNMAFYEHLGPEGMSLLQLIIQRIPEHIPVILDGKRGDIGNTSSHYAHAMFDNFRASWVTLNPYMGYDSMRPFLERKDKGVFVLCLTSNAGSRDFQQLMVGDKHLYRVVAEKVNYWNKDDNCGLVVGATHPEQLTEIRQAAGDMPLLIPGVGAQGGSLEKAALAGTDGFRKTAVINVSRSVLYASNGPDFAQKARQELEKLNGIINGLRVKEAEAKKESGRAPDPSAPEQQQPSTPEHQQRPDQQQQEQTSPDHGPQQPQSPDHGPEQPSPDNDQTTAS